MRTMKVFVGESGLIPTKHPTPTTKKIGFSWNSSTPTDSPHPIPQNALLPKLTYYSRRHSIAGSSAQARPTQHLTPAPKQVWIPKLIYPPPGPSPQPPQMVAFLN